MLDRQCVTCTGELCNLCAQVKIEQYRDISAGWAKVSMQVIVPQQPRGSLLGDQVCGEAAMCFDSDLKPTSFAPEQAIYC